MKTPEEIGLEVYEKIFAKLPCIYPPEYRDELKTQIALAISQEREKVIARINDAFKKTAEEFGLEVYYPNPTPNPKEE